MAAATAASHVCRKHRINQVFARPEAERIDHAISFAVHPVMSEVTLLLKHRLMEETSALGAAGRDVAPLVIDVDDVERAISAVVGKVQVRRSRGQPDGAAAGGEDAGRALRLAQATAWEESYSRMRQKTFRADEVDPPMPLKGRLDDCSVRRILSNAARQYVACMLTNIRYHYADYVRRSIGRVLRIRAASLEGVASFDDLSKQRKLAWGRLFRVAHDDLLQFRDGGAMQTDARLRDLVVRHRPMLVPSRRAGARTVDEDLCSASRCFVYLGYMVRMTAAMQAVKEHRLPCPLPLKTSFIPSHYTIDTGSACHLLFGDPGGRKTLKKFVRYFEHSVKGGFPLPGLRDMSDVCGGLQKLCGPDTLITPIDEQRYMDALWTYLGRFNRRKAMRLCPIFQVTQRRMAVSGSPMMLFDHSVATDGYSVSLGVTDGAVRGRHGFVPTCRDSARKKRKTTGAQPFYDESGVPTDASTGLPILTPATAAYWADRFQNDPKLAGSNKTGGDPGKGVLLQLVGTVDGRRKNVRYTAKQRTFDAGGGKRAQRLQAARTKNLPNVMLSYEGVPVDPRINSIEKGLLRTCSPKAASLPAFREYVRKRDAVRGALEALYARKVFRWGRFIAWAKRDLSVTRFAKKIVETYGSGGKPVVVFYGDWGRNPNLKNQAPTPGIGLRRLLHKFEGILTITVREMYTSSYCPRCSAEVDNARGVHGLLKCVQDRADCGMYWSRDVLGASNILAKAMYMLEHPGDPHPLFLG